MVGLGDGNLSWFESLLESLFVLGGIVGWSVFASWEAGGVAFGWGSTSLWDVDPL